MKVLMWFFIVLLTVFVVSCKPPVLPNKGKLHDVVCRQYGEVVYEGVAKGYYSISNGDFGESPYIQFTDREGRYIQIVGFCVVIERIARDHGLSSQQ